MTNGRKRQPVNLILANGKRHFSRKELDERRARELSVPFKNIKAPSYLTTPQKRTFNIYAKKLQALDILTELDVDVLAQYVIALELYTTYSAQIREIASKGEPVDAWEAINSITLDCEDAAKVVDLLERLVRRQRASELSALTTLQDKAFKQCLACARELGLSITSRAKIEVPPPPDGGEDDEL